MDFLNQVWSQSTDVIGCALIAFIIVKLLKKNKKLSYELLYSGSLLRTTKGLENDLSIHYQGHPVEQLSTFKPDLTQTASKRY
jgi:hypothetical protein